MAIGYAAQDGNNPSVRLLASHGADMNLALESATDGGQIQTVKLILSEYAHKFKNQTSKESILLLARSCTNYEITETLMTFAGITWSEVTNHFLVHPTNSSNTQRARIAPPHLEGHRFEESEFSRFSFGGNDGTSITAFMRSIRTHEGDHRDRAAFESQLRMRLRLGRRMI